MIFVWLKLSILFALHGSCKSVHIQRLRLKLQLGAQLMLSLAGPIADTPDLPTGRQS